MNKLLFILLITSMFCVSTFAMQHDTTGISILIIKENEWGRYDTTYCIAKTVFNFDNKFIVDGWNYAKPKYDIKIKD